MDVERIEQWMERMADRCKTVFVWGLIVFGLICAVRVTVGIYGICAIVFWVGATATGVAAWCHMSSAVQDAKGSKGRDKGGFE